MKRIAFRVVPVAALLVAGVAWLGPRAAGQSSPMPSTKNGDWPMYTADIHGSKYSPLDQINAGNFSKLEVAWRFKTDNLGPRPETKLEGTPIMIGDTVYATAGTRRAVVALNAATGEQKWMYAMDEGERATRWAPRQLSGRGLSYWTDGKGDDRVVYVTTGYRLVSLNAKTGQPIAGFGTRASSTSRSASTSARTSRSTSKRAKSACTPPPHIVNDMIIVGSSMFEGLGYVYSTNAKGVVRAFDARTGKLIWRFDTIPKPGEFGNETWENGSWEWTGNVGVWTEITATPKRVSCTSPSRRPPSTSTAATALATTSSPRASSRSTSRPASASGTIQFVHHALWDHDMSAWRLVIDVNIDGKPRKVLAVPSQAGLALHLRSHHRSADLAD